MYYKLIPIVLGLLAYTVAASPDLSNPTPPLKNTAMTGKGAYIVQLKSEITARSLDAHFQLAQKLHSKNLWSKPDQFKDDPELIYKIEVGEFKGFVARLLPTDVDFFRKRPDVSRVIEDIAIEMKTPDEKELSVVAEELKGGRLSERAIRKNIFATPALARISKRKASDRKPYAWDDRGDGDDMYAYVLDSGIREDHTCVIGRTTNLLNLARLPNGQLSANTDDNGHGTYSASLIGGVRVGVLQNVNLVSIKACTGRDISVAATLIGLVEAKDHIEKNNRKGKSVIYSPLYFYVNMALAHPEHRQTMAMMQTLHSALWHTGHVVVVPAGNLGSPVEEFFPPNLETVITVGAANSTAVDDVFRSSSNFGRRVDLFAPGNDVLGATYADPGELTKNDGTSVAAALVAGLALYYMKLEGLTEPADVKRRLIETSTKNIIKGMPLGTPNRMAYNMARGELGNAA